MIFTRIILPVLLIFAFCLLTGCGQKTATGDLGVACESDRDCQQGQACVITPEFLKDTTASTDVTSASALPAPTLDQFLSAPEPAPDPATGETLPEEKSCQIPCRADVDCPKDFFCVAVGEEASTGLCLDQAQTTEVNQSEE